MKTLNLGSKNRLTWGCVRVCARARDSNKRLVDICVCGDRVGMGVVQVNSRSGNVEYQLDIIVLGSIDHLF